MLNNIKTALPVKGRAVFLIGDDMKTKKINRILLCILTAFLALFSVFESALSIKTKADEASEETVTYSDVLDDLKKDETFDETQYPEKADDYSLQVIQLAESTDGELLVYVYQPSHSTKDLTATEIRLSAPRTGVVASFSDYKLTLISENGVFDKYLVEGFSIFVEDVVRYYEIVQIVRPWDFTIDKESETNNTYNTVPYAVAKRYACYNFDGKYYVSCDKIEVAYVTDKYVGFVRYEDNYNLFGRTCDSHFVAFKTDIPIENLVSAKIGYSYGTVKQEYSASGFGTYEEDGLTFIQNYRYTNGPVYETEKTLKASERVEIETGGIFNRTYSWTQIQTMTDFLSNDEDAEFTTEASEAFEKMDWVFRFYESDYSLDGAVNFGYWEKNYTRVSNVTIIELTYAVGDDCYTIGVVDNKQTGSSTPSGTVTPDYSKNLYDLLKIVLIILVIGFLLSILLPILPKIFGVVFAVFKWIIKALWWIISFPFNLLGKRKKKQDSAPDGRSNSPPHPQNPEKQKKK